MMTIQEPRRTVRPDSKGRVTLGNLASGVSSFKAYRDPEGRIILEPQVEVPASEAWLWQNPKALASVRRGLEQSATGQLIDRGDFTQYIDEDAE